MKWFYGLLIAISVIGIAQASSPNWQDKTKWENWPTVGKTSLSWLFLKIFKSELKSPSGTYVESGDVTPHPMALSIIYQRDITKEQLIKATREQWDYLGYSEELQKEWLLTLDKIYTNVSKGERLVYVTDGSKGEFIFYDKSLRPKDFPQHTGKIDSEPLNDAILSIWLSPGTEYPKQRKQLIGRR